MRKLLAGAALALSLAGCTQVVEPPPPTDAELATYIREQQDLLWFEYGSLDLERPEAKSELVASDSSSGDVAQCGASQIIVDEESGVATVTALPSSETALYECQAAQIPYPTDVEYYTPAQLGAIYDYFRDSLVPCLQVQGLDVGVAPSRDEFVGVAGSIPWDPYTELGADLPPSRAAEIRARCAALPDADFLSP